MKKSFVHQPFFKAKVKKWFSKGKYPFIYERRWEYWEQINEIRKRNQEDEIETEIGDKRDYLNKEIEYFIPRTAHQQQGSTYKHGRKRSTPAGRDHDAKMSFVLTLWE